MDRDDFVERCVSGGHCSKVFAKNYEKDKTELSEDDIAEAWRKNEHLLDIQNNGIKAGVFIEYEGERSTRHLSYNGKLGRDK